MPDFLLHINVKPGREQAALEALTDIEHLSRRDEGCVTFVWLQHQDDPLRFTLFEQWETQEELDAHLARIIPHWQRFEPNLAGEPVSETVVPVTAVKAAQSTGA
jgi:quinol monooxygenase YgiN